MTNRESFEAWASDGALFDLTPDPNAPHGYANSHTAMAYEGFGAGWQASRVQMANDAAEEVLTWPLDGMQHDVAAAIQALATPEGDPA